MGGGGGGHEIDSLVSLLDNRVNPPVADVIVRPTSYSTSIITIGLMIRILTR